MERMAQILILIHEQDGKSGSHGFADPPVIPDHPKGNERHIFKVDQVVASKLRFIGFDEVR
ncbi:hypothetical protein D3C75_1041480 [compost metagenome]